MNGGSFARGCGFFYLAQRLRVVKPYPRSGRHQRGAAGAAVTSADGRLSSTIPLLSTTVVMR